MESAFESSFSLPNISELLSFSTTVYGWRHYIDSHLVAESYITVLDECSCLPLGCSLVPGQPIPHWGITLSFIVAIRCSILCVRLLVDCGVLMDFGHPVFLLLFMIASCLVI